MLLSKVSLIPIASDEAIKLGALQMTDILTYIQENISAMAVIAKIVKRIGGFLTSANCVL